MKKIAVTAVVTSAAWIGFMAYVITQREKNRKARHDRNYSS